MSQSIETRRSGIFSRAFFLVVAGSGERERGIALMELITLMGKGNRGWDGWEKWKKAGEENAQVFNT
jgi:hypothetical protein